MALRCDIFGLQNYYLYKGREFITKYFSADGVSLLVPMSTLVEHSSVITV